MKLRVIVSLVVLLIGSLFVSAQDDVTYEPYTSPDGRISFESPAGWAITPFGQFFSIAKHGFYVEPADMQPGQQTISVGLLNMEELGISSDLGPVDFTTAVLDSFGDETPDTVVIDGSRTITLASGVEAGAFDLSEGTARHFVLTYPQDGVAIMVSANAHESETAVLEPITLHVANSIVLGEMAADVQAMPEYPVVNIIGTDEGMQLPPVPEEGVPAGMYTFQLTNSRGDATFSSGLARINDGISMDEFMAVVMSENSMDAVAMVSLYGGAGDLAPGESFSYTVNLHPGNYLMLEFGPEGPPSDLVPFIVVEGDMMDVVEPDADVHLAMVDFAFGVPGFMPSGEQLWHLDNIGDQWHEVAVMPLPEGVESVSDVMEMMASGSEPDVQPAFFWAPMSAGTEAWVTVDLEPGSYVVLCFLPDLNGDFSPHMNHGMIQVFTVQ